MFSGCSIHSLCRMSSALSFADSVCSSASSAAYCSVIIVISRRFRQAFLCRITGNGLKSILSPCASRNKRTSRGRRARAPFARVNTHLEDHLVHVVQIREVGLRVGVIVKEMDSGGARVTRLGDHGAQRPPSREISRQHHVLNYTGHSPARKKLDSSVHVDSLRKKKNDLRAELGENGGERGARGKEGIHSLSREPKRVRLMFK